MNLALHGFLLQVFVSILDFQHGSLLCSAGEPGYLDFDNLPETNFSCQGKVIGGYYADVEAGCQMFHVCTIGQKDEIMDIKFLCLNGTVFDQETRVCERVDEVDCSKSERFYNLNLELYGNNAVTLSLHENSEEEDDPSHSVDEPQRTSSARPPTTTTTTTTTTSKPSKPSTTPATGSFSHPTGYPQHYQPQPPFPQVHTSQSKSLYDDKNGGYHHQYIFHNGERNNNQATSYQLFSNQGVSSTTVQTPQVHQIRYSSSSSPQIIHEPSTVAPLFHSTSSTIQTLLNSNANSPALINPIFHNHGIASTTEQFSIHSNNPRDTSDYRDAGDQGIRPLEAIQSTNKGKVSKLTISPVPMQPEPARPIAVKASPTQQRLTSSFLPTPPTIETTIRSFYPTPRTSSKSSQSQSSGEQITQHIHVLPPVVIPQLKPHQITINLPPPDIQRIVQNPSPLLPSQSRVIVTAKASVSDESGRPLNTTQLVTLPLPTIPASYDDYKEGDESFDPFYRDVPKIRSSRREIKAMMGGRNKRSVETNPGGGFAYGVEDRGLKVLEIQDEGDRKFNVEDFQPIKESLIKFRDLLLSGEITQDALRGIFEGDERNLELENGGRELDDLETRASKHSKAEREGDSKEGVKGSQEKSEGKIVPEGVEVESSEETKGEEGLEKERVEGKEVDRVIDVVLIDADEYRKLKSDGKEDEGSMRDVETTTEEVLSTTKKVETESRDQADSRNSEQERKEPKMKPRRKGSRIRPRGRISARRKQIKNVQRENEEPVAEKASAANLEQVISQIFEEESKNIGQRENKGETTQEKKDLDVVKDDGKDEAKYREPLAEHSMNLTSDVVENVPVHSKENSTEKSDEVLAGKLEEKPVENLDEKLRGKSEEKWVGKSDEKSEQKSVEKSEETSLGKSDEKSEEKSEEKVEDKSTEKSEEKVEDKSTEKSEESAEKSREKSMEKSEEKWAGKSEENSTEESVGKSDQNSAEESVGKSDENSEENWTEKSAENSDEKWPEKSSENSDEKWPEKSLENSDEKWPEKSSENSDEKWPKKSSENSDEKWPEKSEEDTEELENSTEISQEALSAEEHSNEESSVNETSKDESKSHESSEASQEHFDPGHTKHHYRQGKSKKFEFSSETFSSLHSERLESEEEQQSQERSTVRSSEETTYEEISSEYHDSTESSFEDSRDTSAEDYTSSESPEETTTSESWEANASKETVEDTEDSTPNDHEDSTEGVLKFTDELPKDKQDDVAEATTESVESVHDYVDDNYEPDNYKEREATNTNNLSEEKGSQSKEDKSKEVLEKDVSKKESKESLEKDESKEEIQETTLSPENIEPKKELESPKQSNETDSTTTIRTTMMTTTIRPTPPKLFKPAVARKSYNYFPPTTTPNPVRIKSRPILNPKPSKPVKSYNDLAPKPVIRKFSLLARKTTTPMSTTLPEEVATEVPTTPEAIPSHQDLVQDVPRKENTQKKEDQVPSPSERKSEDKGFTPYPLMRLTTLQNAETTLEVSTKPFTLVDVTTVSPVSEATTASPMEVTSEGNFAAKSTVFHRKTLPRRQSFNCFEKEMYRFYGDKRDCRLFHYCSPGFTSRQVLDFRFVCEEGTAFDEESQSCRHDVRSDRCPGRPW